MLFLGLHILHRCGLTEQQHHFFQSPIKQVLTYNIELWYNSATDKHKDKLLKPFIRNNYFLATKFYVQNSVLKLSIHFIYYDDHILRDCYTTNRKLKLKFLMSFVHFVFQQLNNLRENMVSQIVIYIAHDTITQYIKLKTELLY